MSNTQTTSQLAYSLDSNPNPLITALPGSIIIDFEPTSGSSVVCKTIKLTIEYGDTDTDIYSDLPASQLINVDGWTLNASEIKPDSGVTLTLTNTAPGYYANKGYLPALQLFGTVNTSTSDIDITISDDSAPAANGILKTTSNTTTLNIVKTTGPNYLNNFIALDPNVPEIPKVAFENGSQLELSWKGNATSYALYQGDKPLTLKSDTDTTYTIKEGLNNTTTFVVKATYAGSGGVDLHLYATLTITINNPELTPMQITGGLPTSNLEIESGTFIKGGLKVQEKATFDKRILANDGMVAQGDSILNNTEVDGSLGVTGHLKMQDTTVNGLSNFNNNVNLNSAVLIDSTGGETTSLVSVFKSTIQMFSAYQKIYSKKLTAGAAADIYTGTVIADSIIVVNIDASDTNTDHVHVSLVYDSITFEFDRNVNYTSTNLFTLPIPLNTNSGSNTLTMTTNNNSGGDTITINLYAIALGSIAGLPIATVTSDEP